MREREEGKEGGMCVCVCMCVCVRERERERERESEREIASEREGGMEGERDSLTVTDYRSCMEVSCIHSDILVCE